LTAKLRRLVVPGISTLAMLAILLGLGTWQVERLQWKTALLARLDAAEAAPGVPLPPVPEPFEKVRIEGRLLGNLRATYAAEVHDTREGPVLGTQLIVPMERAGGETVLVDLGWIPSEQRQSVAIPTGVVPIDGYVRPAEHPGWFSATDNPGTHEFYTLDPQAIAASLGVGSVTPFTLIAMGAAPPGGYPEPAQHLPRPPNNHLQYALTWFGLAVVLVIIFAAYVHKREDNVRRI
jgi:surfeit locus 1 family protein